MAIILAEVGEERVFRFVAALSIGAAALSLVIPLLHRISKRDVQQDGLTSVLDERSIASIDEQIAELRQRIAHLEELRAQIAGHHRSTRG